MWDGSVCLVTAGRRVSKEGHTLIAETPALYSWSPYLFPTFNRLQQSRAPRNFGNHNAPKFRLSASGRKLYLWTGGRTESRSHMPMKTATGRVCEGDAGAHGAGGAGCGGDGGSHRTAANGWALQFGNGEEITMRNVDSSRRTGNAMVTKSNRDQRSRLVKRNTRNTILDTHQGDT